MPQVLCARTLHGFDPDALEQADPTEVVVRLRAVKAGNRSLSAQMRHFAGNLRTLRGIDRDLGSIDRFVTSAAPEEITRRLADPRSPYKFKQLGFALAMQYLRNVGVSTAKPDTHVLCILVPERSGCFEQGT